MHDTGFIGLRLTQYPQILAKYEITREQMERLTAKCFDRIESQRERAVVSHISQKTSEIWGTRPSRGMGDLIQKLRPGLGLIIGSPHGCFR